MKKYNTLILLSVITALLNIIWNLVLSTAFTQFAVREGLDVLTVLLIKTSVNMLIYIFPATWIFKNSPRSVNKWLSFLMVVFFGFMGVIGYFLLVGIDCLKDEKQKAEPAHGPYGENAG